MRVEFLCLAAAASLFAGCASPQSHRLTLSQLPPAVQQTVRREVGTLPIVSITEERRYGVPSYLVEVDQPGRNGLFWVDQDGQILRENRSFVAEQQRRMNESAGAPPPKESTPLHSPHSLQ